MICSPVTDFGVALRRYMLYRVASSFMCSVSVCVLSTVVDPSTTHCNTTLQLDDAGVASYLVGVTSAGARSDAVSAYPRSCPLRVAVRGGQTVNITLYGIGRSDGPWSTARRQSTSAAAVRRQRFCAAHVFIGEGERSQGAPLCPAGQQRVRHLYQSRGSVVTVHFSAQQRGAAADSTTTATTRLFFILEMQGECPLRHVPSFYIFIDHVVVCHVVTYGYSPSG